ncbi:hypothetical protein [Burkholderia ubonensis]|uniref:hypothetical protein n=1 Tax=Burkholderia ubonensis TaxID=101571 RepID=UPI00075D1E69|nr:hypothetical protein [Burkholderia ubonensis]KVD10689.1 hypothetical protein WI81_25845 [Burkholderia ubonensis]KVR56850.1 hypothetical protein WK19_11705 [Burkholderia ubonensis]KWB43296.1 hypothetical protein WL37_18795 [Burkholderia ubonensis]KWD52217.1 hypothetical protein WL65_05335 [Burkholderia ubonensis]
MNESASPHVADKPARHARTARRWWLALAAAGALLAGCAQVDSGPVSPFEANGGHSDLRMANTGWAVLPIENNTETANAGQRAASIVAGFLRAQGYTDVREYRAPGDDGMFVDWTGTDVGKAKKWATDNHLRYGLTGAVNEWRYKVGVDGEPAIGIALQIIDLQTGAVVWSGTASRTGWSRDAATSVAQGLVRQLLTPVVGSGERRARS